MAVGHESCHLSEPNDIRPPHASAPGDKASGFPCDVSSLRSLIYTGFD